MKTFYKIENNQLQVGQGTVIPDGFIEYTVGQEPDELKEALALEAIEQARVELKQAKEVAKASIKVTTSNGNVFDGNMESRVNMQNVITASEILGQTTADWKLADNSVVTVDIAEIKEALALSIQECGRIVMVTSIEEL